VENDFHCFVLSGDFFLAFYCARHIELKIERNQLEWTMTKLAIVSNRHDEVHSVDTNSPPATLAATLADPLAGNIRPDLIFDPGLGFIANPARFAREDQSRFACERKQDVHVPMHNLES